MRAVLGCACIDPRIVECFSGYEEVKTAFDLNWHQLKDHELVKNLRDRFDVLVTIDRGFEHEHNLKTLGFGIVLVHVDKNKVEFYRPLYPQIRAAVNSVGAGQVKHVYGARTQ